MCSQCSTRAPEVNRLLLDHFAHEGGLMPPEPTPDDDAYADGLRVRREVLGDEYVDAALAAATPLTAPFQEHITRSAWGAVWGRDVLDRRTRSCLTVALLTALRAEDELALHIRAALRNGLTPEEIVEVMLHTSVYAGVPAANTAIAVARRVFHEA